jgi:hypothetical protein
LPSAEQGRHQQPCRAFCGACIPVLLGVCMSCLCLLRPTLLSSVCSLTHRAYAIAGNCSFHSTQVVRGYSASSKRLFVLGYNATLTHAVEVSLGCRVCSSAGCASGWLSIPASWLLGPPPPEINTNREPFCGALLGPATAAPLTSAQTGVVDCLTAAWDDDATTRRPRGSRSATLTRSRP